MVLAGSDRWISRISLLISVQCSLAANRLRQGGVGWCTLRCCPLSPLRVYVHQFVRVLLCLSLSLSASVSVCVCVGPLCGYNYGSVCSACSFVCTVYLTSTPWQSIQIACILKWPNTRIDFKHRMVQDTRGHFSSVSPAVTDSKLGFLRHNTFLPTWKLGGLVIALCRISCTNRFDRTFSSIYANVFEEVTVAAMVMVVVTRCRLCSRHVSTTVWSLAVGPTRTCWPSHLPVWPWGLSTRAESSQQQRQTCSHGCRRGGER